MSTSKSQYIASSSILGLLAASNTDAAIITNTSLGLEGFTVEGGMFGMEFWDVDGSGSYPFSFIASRFSSPGWSMPGFYTGPYSSIYMPGSYIPGF